MHDAVFVFLRHTVSNEGLEYLALVITEAVTLQFCAGVLDVAPFVPLIEIGCKGIYNFIVVGSGGQDSEAVLSNDQGQTAAIVPFHMELPASSMFSSVPMVPDGTGW